MTARDNGGYEVLNCFSTVSAAIRDFVCFCVPTFCQPPVVGRLRSSPVLS